MLFGAARSGTYIETIETGLSNRIYRHSHSRWTISRISFAIYNICIITRNSIFEYFTKVEKKVIDENYE